MLLLLLKLTQASFIRRAPYFPRAMNNLYREEINAFY